MRWWPYLVSDSTAASFENLVLFTGLVVAVNDVDVFVFRSRRRSQMKHACFGSWGQTGMLTFCHLDFYFFFFISAFLPSHRRKSTIQSLNPGKPVFLCLYLLHRDIVLQSTPTDDPLALSNLYILTGHESSYWKQEDGKRGVGERQEDGGKEKSVDEQRMEAAYSAWPTWQDPLLKVVSLPSLQSEEDEG